MGAALHRAVPGPSRRLTITLLLALLHPALAGPRARPDNCRPRHCHDGPGRGAAGADVGAVRGPSLFADHVFRPVTSSRHTGLDAARDVVWRCRACQDILH